MIEIRLLNEMDVDAYQQLRLNNFQESPYAFSESYEDEIKRAKATFLQELQQVGNPPEQFILGVFDAPSNLIGFVKFRRDQRSKARHKSMIHAMYIKAAYRNQQLGKRLILELIESVQKLKGLEQIHLWVLHASTSAANFYRSCGFESQGPIVKNDLKIGEEYVHAEYMVLYLNQEMQG